MCFDIYRYLLHCSGLETQIGCIRLNLGGNCRGLSLWLRGGSAHAKKPQTVVHVLTGEFFVAHPEYSTR